MDFTEARQKFINAWGALGSSWGMNRTITQIHALLLISPEPLSADDVMAELGTSRGNTNINLRELAAWGLTKRVHKPGDRKEYYEALKDMHKVAMLILKERRKRELEPLLHLLEDFKGVKTSKSQPDEKVFIETLNEIQKFSARADKVIETAIRADENWFWKALMGFMK